MCLWEMSMSRIFLSFLFLSCPILRETPVGGQMVGRCFGLFRIHQNQRSQKPWHPRNFTTSLQRKGRRHRSTGREMFGRSVMVIACKKVQGPPKKTVELLCKRYIHTPGAWWPIKIAHSRNARGVQIDFHHCIRYFCECVVWRPQKDTLRTTSGPNAPFNHPPPPKKKHVQVCRVNNAWEKGQDLGAYKIKYKQPRATSTGQGQEGPGSIFGPPEAFLFCLFLSLSFFFAFASWKEQHETIKFQSLVHQSFLFFFGFLSCFLI